MKTKLLSQTRHTRLTIALLVLALLVTSRWTFAQPSSLHQISAISFIPEGSVLLTLAGTPPKPLQPYYDLFPVEASANLIDWQVLATVVRTNVTNEIVLADATAASNSARFYRTPTNQFSTAFPAPTGPHPVGTVSRMLTDASRTNRYGVRTNSSFVATFWYPAQAQAGNWSAPYQDRLLAEHRPYWSAYTNRVPSLVQMASAKAAAAAAPERFPVIIYTHGLGTAEGRGVRTENTEKMQELASHGYVVIAVDHTDAYGLVLPPDQLIVGRNAFSFNFLNDRLKDIEFLLNYLGQLNADDVTFRDRMNLDRIGIMGWSFGGGTAGEACRLQDRLKVAVLLDGYLGSMPNLTSKGLAKPFLTMNSPSSGLAGDNTTLFNKSPKDAYQLSIKDANHEAFTDNSWIVNPSAATRRRALAMNACLVSFLNKHLKGMDDTLIENPGMTHSDVISFRKK